MKKSGKPVHVSRTYYSYSRGTVVVANLVNLAIYASGAAIISELGYAWMAVYLAAVLFQEYRLIKTHCVDCFYFGKRCAFGKGLVSGLLFRRGNPQRFNAKKMSWKDLLPDLALSLFPLIVGLVFLVIEFHWSTLGLVGILVLAATSGNSYVRGQLACKYCKQRKLGCQAECLFRKGK
jgi:hypothetical protein